MSFYVTSKGQRLALLDRPDNKLLKYATASNIPLNPNYMYLRNWAVSAFEKFGLNENADGFLDAELGKGYPSFDKSWVCLNHVAFDANDSMGENFNPIYTPEKYVELIIGIDKDRAEIKKPGLVERIRKGEVTDTSMGCYAEGSVCTACGNIARDKSDYCEHLMPNLMGVSQKGKQIIIWIAGKSVKITVGELYFNVEFVENSIIDTGCGADPNAKIFEVAAAKAGCKVVCKDDLYYAIRQIERRDGQSRLTARLLQALERKNI